MTVAAFRPVFEDFRQSYVLRYAPTRRCGRPAGMGIDVKIARQGRFDVRARKGYFAG